MIGVDGPTSQRHVIDRYVAMIEAHLLRLAEGRDPPGHLLGIERLARGARAEWSAERRGVERRR